MSKASRLALEREQRQDDRWKAHEETHRAIQVAVEAVAHRKEIADAAELAWQKALTKHMRQTKKGLQRQIAALTSRLFTVGGIAIVLILVTMFIDRLFR